MLIYTGGGWGGTLPGIPARDLSDEEVQEHGGEAALLASGLYARPESKAKRGGRADKALRGGAADKAQEGE